VNYDKPMAGYEELEKSYHLIPYRGDKCFAPKELYECINEIMIERYKKFLHNNSGHTGKGVMTEKKMASFNNKFNTNYLRYNENDRHLYPKKMLEIIMMTWFYIFIKTTIVS
jgi:hypothetical protein